MIWDPWKEMEQIRKKMDDLIGSFGQRNIEFGTATPAMDMYQDNEDMVIKMDLPGVEKDEIDLSITEDMVSVSAKKKKVEQEEREDFYRSERLWTSYQRSASLPVKVDSEKAKAKYKNGTLEIKAPIKEKAKAKKKKIKVE